MPRFPCARAGPAIRLPLACSDSLLRTRRCAQPRLQPTAAGPGCRPPRNQRAKPHDFRALGFWLVLLHLASAKAVAASEVVIEWTAPAECPDHAELVSRVEQALGDAVTANLTASARVTRAADSFSARLRITSAAGFAERTLEGARCDIVADSVALVIAMSAPRSAGPKPAPSNVSPVGATMPGLTFRLSAHGTASIGTLPRIGLGVGGTLALEALSALRLELGGTYYVPQIATFTGVEAGAHFSALRVGARGCGLWAIRPLDLGACLGAQLQRIEGKGFGGAVPRSGAALYLGPSVGVFVRLHVWRSLAVHVAADAVWFFTRQRFVFGGLGPLFQPARSSFQVFIGPEVQF